MIIRNIAKRDGLLVTNSQYFGKNAVNFLERHSDIKYLSKECTVKEKQGIIIGIEDNKELENYYYIIYILKDEKVCYELATNNEFIKTIII